VVSRFVFTTLTDNKLKEQELELPMKKWSKSKSLVQTLEVLTTDRGYLIHKTFTLYYSGITPDGPWCVKKMTGVCGSRYHVADGTAWQRDQEHAGASIRHPLNHDRSNAE